MNTLVLILSAVIAGFTGYGSKIATQPVHTTTAVTSQKDAGVESIKVKLQWEFETKLTEDNVPYTTVYLHTITDKDEKTKIGTYVGNFQEVTAKNCAWGFPEKSMTQCLGWYGGQGDILAVVKKSSGEIVIQRRHIEESGRDAGLEAELDKMVFKDVITIQLPKNAEIECLEAVK